MTRKSGGMGKIEPQSATIQIGTDCLMRGRGKRERTLPPYLPLHVEAKMTLSCFDKSYHLHSEVVQKSILKMACLKIIFHSTYAIHLIPLCSILYFTTWNF
jgi:hypothetical protein